MAVFCGGEYRLHLAVQRDAFVVTFYQCYLLYASSIVMPANLVLYVVRALLWCNVEASAIHWAGGSVKAAYEVFYHYHLVG